MARMRLARLRLVRVRPSTDDKRVAGQRRPLARRIRIAVVRADLERVVAARPEVVVQPGGARAQRYPLEGSEQRRRRCGAELSLQAVDEGDILPNVLVCKALLL